MSEFLKPQSPLQHSNGSYIYPLTTADQVILEDGTRLNSIDFSAPSLPYVTPSDNGKFLRVVNGVWAAENVLRAEEASF